MRILLVRMDHVGDFVATMPACIAAIRTACPDAVIHVLTTHRNAPFLDGGARLDKVLLFDPPWSVLSARGRFGRFSYAARMALLGLLGWVWRCRYGYDVAFFLSLSYWERLVLRCVASRRVGFRLPHEASIARVSDRTLTSTVEFDTSCHELDNCNRMLASVLPVPSKIRCSTVRVNEEVRREAVRHLDACITLRRPVLMIHPGGGKFRMWPMDRFTSLAQLWVRETQGSVVVAAGPKEVAYAWDMLSQAQLDGMAAVQTVSYYDFAAMVSLADIYLGHDAGPAHIAAVVGVPTAVLFGPTSPVVYRPLGSYVRVIESGKCCAPCRFPWRTPVPCVRGLVCLTDITVERVLAELRDLLNERRAGG